MTTGGRVAEPVEVQPGALNLPDGGYLDWSCETDDGGRTFELGTAGGIHGAAVSLDLTPGQLREQLNLTLTGDERAGHVLYLDADERSYLDWSTPRPDGGRHLEIGDADGNAVNVELTREQLQALHDQLAEDIIEAVPDAPEATSLPEEADMASSDDLPEVKDRLKVAGRVPVGDGEVPAGSDYVRDDDAGLACVVAVATPDGPTVRIGLPISAEDKRSWRGADRGSTVVLDPDGVRALTDGVEEVIAAAQEPYRQLERDYHAAQAERLRMEALRFDPNVAQRKVDADWRVAEDERIQRSRLQKLRQALGPLPADQQAAYDQLEHQYQQHVDVRGDDAAIAQAQAERRAIRARQVALVTPLSEQDVHHLFDLDAIPTSQLPYREGQQVTQQMNEILARTGTSQFGGGYVNWVLTHHSGATELDEHRRTADALEAQSQPVDEETLQRLQEARRRHEAAEAAYDQVAGWPIATVEILGQWGTVVIQAVQGEEGHAHSYHADVRPPDASEQWSPGDDGETWRPKPHHLRKLAQTAQRLLQTKFSTS